MRAAPQERRHGFQKRRVAIQFFGRLKNLQIASQMPNHETEQDQSRDGHDCFLADSGLPEAQRAGLKVYGGGAHGMDWSFCLL